MFFDLFSTGRLEGRRVRLVDINPDLIGCYRAVRDHTEEVIAALASLEREHRAGGEACYYDVRDNRFNAQRAGGVNYTSELAAMFIYLNRTGFNGLFRLNRGGAFNVPAGRYAAPRICDAAHVRRVAAAFSTVGVALECVGFDTVLADARAGDFVYCDPPYAPLSRTASFAHYTAGGFTSLDHVRLQRAVLAAARRGGARVQLERAGDCETVLRRHGAAGRARRAPRAGPPRHQLARLCPRTGRGADHYQRASADAGGRPATDVARSARSTIESKTGLIPEA